MFVIMVYDINVKRVAKVLKTSRRYLSWVQNSVFEGEITPGCLGALKRDLTKIFAVSVGSDRRNKTDRREIVSLGGSTDIPSSQG